MTQTLISTAQAQAIVAAGQAKAAEIGVPVNIAVLDAGAHLKAFARMDGAVLGSIDVSMGKARTSVLFDIRSEAVWDYAKPGAPAPGLENTNGGLVPFGGGVPLKTVDGLTLGAVGVSGGAVAQDVAIAEAAAAALTA
ncbi:MAG: heme-binding protein [Caulobacter sp.]